MRRRGTIEISLTTLLETFAIFVICLIIFIVGFKVYHVFFGPDKEALNTYELIYDNLDSLVKTAESEKSLEFRFTFPLVTKTAGVQQGHQVSIKGRDNYDGTIWAVDTKGVISHPFPAWRFNDKAGQQYQLDPAALRPPIPRSKLDKRCRATACLCFSKHVLAEDATDDDLRQFFTDPTRCHAFELPEGSPIQNIAFDFTQKKFTKADKQYASVLMRKTTPAPGRINLEVHLFSPTVP